MDNFVLSATLELKDKMTAGLKKTQYALSGVAKELEKTSKTSDELKGNLDKLKGDYSITLSAKDKISQATVKAKSLLEQFKNKDYSSLLSIKDRASTQIIKVKSELAGLASKAFTTYVNIKTNMPNGAFNFNNKFQNFADGMLMGTSLQMAGMAGIGYTVYDTIKTPMDFDSQLSAIKALIPKDGIDGQTRDEIMSQVRARAMQLGQDTVFGNTEVAKGMTELIKAGVQLKDVLGEASEAALNLATAGGLDLAESAETMSTAMNAFKVNDATHAANILAGAANASATDVHELRYALSMCSAVASGAGVSFEDTNTTLAVFAQNGLKGSDAGTSLKTMLSNLIPKTKTQIEAFSKLNLITEKGTSAFFDQQGKVKTLAEIAGLLQDRLKGMTKEEQLATLYDMFGSDAIRGGMILMREGAEGVTKMFNEMNKVTAKDVAITMLDNLKGDIEELSGAWENFQITLMSGSANSGLRSLVQELTDIVKIATSGLKDGFGLDDIFTLAKKGIIDLTNKFIAFDGIGSILAGGALFLGLKKIFNISTSIVFKIKDIINLAKNIPKNLPTELPNQQVTKDIIITAQNVYVNGKNQNSPMSPSYPEKEKTQPSGPTKKNNLPQIPIGFWDRLKQPISSVLDKLKFGANYGKDIVSDLSLKSMLLNIPIGLYDIFTAEKGEQGSAVSQFFGGLLGGLGGAKIGSVVGGIIGAGIGSAIPGVGTVAGASAGANIGAVGGSIIGGFSGQKIGDKVSRYLDFNNDNNIISVNKNIQIDKANKDLNYAQEYSKYVRSIFRNIYKNLIDTSLSASNRKIQQDNNQREGYKNISTFLSDKLTSFSNVLSQSNGLNNIKNIFGTILGTESITQASNTFRPITDFINQYANDYGNNTLQSSQAQIETTEQMYLNLKEIANNAFTDITSSIEQNSQSQLQTIQSQAESISFIWESIKESGCNAWEYIKIKWSESVDWFSANVYMPILSIANSTGTAIANGINSGISSIKSAYNELVSWFDSNIFSPLRSKYLELKNMAPNPVQGVLNFVDGGLGHNATGTMNWEGGLTEINERGGEIVDLPTGSRIYPAQTTERIIKNELTNNYSKINGGNITITGNTFIVRNEQDIDEIAYRLMSLMRQVDANYGGVY